MNRMLASLAALAVFTGASLALAEGPPQHGGPRGGAPGGQPGAAPRAAPPRPAAPAPAAPSPRAMQPSAPQQRAIQQGAAQQQRAIQQQQQRAVQQQRAMQQQQQQRAVQQQRAIQQQQQQRAAQQQRAIQQQQQQRAVQQRALQQQQQQQRAVQQQRAIQQQQQQRGAEQQRNQAAEQQRRAAEQRSAEQKRALEQQRAFRNPKTGEPSGGPDRRNAQARHEEMRQAHAKLSQEQRVRLRSAFPRDRAHISKTRFTARIGSRIPRSVRLFAVPAAAFGIFSYYRDYSYVVLDDAICIVDPETYEIVDVLDEAPYAPGPRLQSAGLSLSSAQVAIVRDSISPDFPVQQLRIRLALGADIPDRIELFEFGPIVLDSVPQLRDYRFVVTHGEVVIVDPRDRSIALVLER